MKIYCTHDDCRAHTKEELLHLATRIPMTLERRAEIINAADDTAEAEVVCRHVPRPGPVNAPFAERK